ncbi:MAG: formylglycine-generating enzyme family protein [Bacteroidetes bacterium]|nr:formylglycine-generating enzyme family protein [Bacteroidota bacterium]
MNRFVIFLLIVSVFPDLKGQDFTDRDMEKLQNSISYLLDDYKTYFNLIGDINETQADRMDAYTYSFLKLFRNENVNVYNDLDPTGETSTLPQVKNYAANIITWYTETGITADFENETTISTPVKISTNQYYINVFVTKSISGLYMGKTYNKQTNNLEFRLAFVKDEKGISPLTIAGINPANNHTEVVADSIHEGDVFFDMSMQKAGPAMVLVEGGCYERKFGWTDYEVCVNDFYISKYEITNEDFCAFLNASREDKFMSDKQYLKIPSFGKYISFHRESKKYAVKPGFERFPVTGITWEEAADYCKWQGGRLPTEAEWQFAAIGGLDDEVKYSGGEDIDEYAWYNKNTDGKPKEVGTKTSNPYGIFDMTGNVFEWCFDNYAEDYYANSPNYNPLGPLRGDYKVVKSCDAQSAKKECLVNGRLKAKPNQRNERIGFRLVRSIGVDEE